LQATVLKRHNSFCTGAPTGRLVYTAYFTAFEYEPSQLLVRSQHDANIRYWAPERSERKHSHRIQTLPSLNTRYRGLSQWRSLVSPHSERTTSHWGSAIRARTERDSLEGSRTTINKGLSGNHRFQCASGIYSVRQSNCLALFSL
jgi:hypothetical protein